MGAWFGTLLKENKYQVVICDSNKLAAKATARKRGFRFTEDQELAIRSSDLVVLATPTRATKIILQQNSRAFSSETLLIEISSVKEPLREILQRLRNRGVPILSIHPMFGSGVKTLRGRTVLATSIPSERNSKKTPLTFQKERSESATV